MLAHRVQGCGIVERVIGGKEVNLSTAPAHANSSVRRVPSLPCKT